MWCALATPEPSCNFHRIKPPILLPTLMFLPGTLCGAEVWLPAYRELGGNWPSVFVDYRYQTSIAAMAAKALADVKGVIIPIGLSMGGIVALDIWRQAAPRVAALGLFDTDPSADTPERRRNRDAQVRTARNGDFRQVVVSQLLPNYFSVTAPPDLTSRNRVISMALEQGVEAFAAQAAALAGRQNAWSLLSQITVPTIVACGAEDRICLPETHARMAATLPPGSATYRLIADAGHLAPLAQPAAVACLLRAWLAEVLIQP